MGWAGWCLRLWPDGVGLEGWRSPESDDPCAGRFQGVIRVHLLEAEKLAQMDHFLGIRGKSDPYAKVSIGLQHFRSKTVYKNLNPTWNEVFEVRGSSAATGSTLGRAGHRRPLALMGLTCLWGNTGQRSGPWGRAGWAAYPSSQTPVLPGVGCGGPRGTAYRCTSCPFPRQLCWRLSNPSKTGNLKAALPPPLSQSQTPGAEVLP